MKIRYHNNIDKVVRIFNIALILGAILEVVIFPTFENVYGCLISGISWLLIWKFVFREKYLYYYVLPTLAVFGFGLCYCVLPLVITLTEGKPLTFNFEYPYITFTNQLLNILTIILAFRLCIHIYGQKDSIPRLWDKIGLFTPPTTKQLWILGAIGVISVLYFAVTQTTETDEMREASGDMIGLLLNYLKPFAALPLCFLFPSLWNGNTVPKVKVLLFLLLVAVIGISTTRRSLVLEMFASIFIIWFLLYLNKERTISGKVAIMLTIVFYLITGPIADLALAMSLNRHNINGTNTFDAVIELYQDKEAMHQMQNAALMLTDNKGNNSLGWSEYYVDNIFLDRLCNIRVLDASISYAETLGHSTKEMRDYFHQYWINQLPSVVVDYLGEKKIVLYSPQDLMVSRRMNNDSLNYGWRVGGDTGIGLSLFGYWYYIYAFIVYFLLFYFFCSIVKVTSKGLMIPPPILAAMYSYFHYFDNGYGIFKATTLLARNGWQLVLFYCSIMFVLRFFKK